jgi:hypothetical protein
MPPAYCPAWRLPGLAQGRLPPWLLAPPTPPRPTAYGTPHPATHDPRAAAPTAARRSTPRRAERRPRMPSPLRPANRAAAQPAPSIWPGSCVNFAPRGLKVLGLQGSLGLTWANRGWRRGGGCLRSAQRGAERPPRGRREGPGLERRAHGRPVLPGRAPHRAVDPAPVVAKWGAGAVGRRAKMGGPAPDGRRRACWAAPRAMDRSGL